MFILLVTKALKYLFLVIVNIGANRTCL